MSAPALSPEAQLRAGLAKYPPEIAARGRAVRAWLRARMPAAVEFVYDKRNHLVIGFGPNERPSNAIFSIIVWPKWVTLCFLQGAELPDPRHVLKGGGNIVRSVRLADATDLDKPELRALIELALERADVPMPASGRRRVLIRQVTGTPSLGSRPQPTRTTRSAAPPGGRGAARPRR